MAVDLLLVNAYIQGTYGIVEKAREHRQPLGLGYVAAYAEENGYSVRILDCDAEGITPANFSELLHKLSPKVVGFSSVTPVIMTTIEMADIVRKYSQDVLIVAGGAHVTALPEETLKRSKIDIIVRGEGEDTIVEILKYSKGRIGLSGIKGISYKDNGKVVHNPDRELMRSIDSLPFPARHLLPMEKYRVGNYLGPYGEKLANIVATRGCLYRCIFCGQDIIFKHTVRMRTAKKIADELEGIIKDFGIRAFLFEDSTFTAKPGLVEETCKEILSRGLKIRWGAMGRVDLVDEKLYRLMKKAGCILIFYGIESGSQDILNRARKNITLDQARKAVKAARVAGIPVNTSFILGLPGENKNTIMKTIDFSIELDPDYATFSLATPYPGTEFYDIAVKEGLDVSDWNKFKSARYSEPMYVPKGLAPDELKLYYKLAYRKFYLRPNYIFKSIFKIKSVGDLMHKMRIALSLVS